MVYDRYTQKNIDNAIEKVKRKQKDLEIRQTKPGLIKFRNSIIENQKRHNYNNEYERLIGVLTNKAITHSANSDQLKARITHLETLGSKAVTGIDPRKKETYSEIMSKVKN
jgi:hypothetical protein